MIGVGLVIALVVLVVGLGGAVLLLRLPTLRLQLAGLALLAVLLPLAAVLFSGLVMYESGHDLAILAVAVAASTVAVVGALLVGRSIGRGVEPLRNASTKIASGDLTARAPAAGPRELADLSVSFNDMATKLEDLFDARTQLVAWASHDLRTPLASLRAMLEATEDGLVEPDYYLPAIREQVAALGNRVEDLFELARIDAGALSIEIQEAQLAGLVRSCLRGLEAEAQARKVTLEADVDDGVTALCSPDEIQRVLFNLLANALRHTPSDGSVAVRVEPREDVVQVTVEDTGEGLEPETARRMFERFWRGDRARSSSRAGAGLGLAIARGLVEAHGGRIWAESRPGGGARVSFTLPAA